MGKTSKTETAQQIDPMLRDEMISQMNLGRSVASMGYNPYEGVTQAAFQPSQQAAMGMSNQLANAFGMEGTAGQGLPTPEEGAYGIMGYSPQTAMGEVDPELQAQLDAFYRQAGTPTDYKAQPSTSAGKK